MTTNHEHLRYVLAWHRKEWSFNEARGTPWDGKIHAAMGDAIQSAIDELAALRKENEELRVDAERYRHLRNAKDTKSFWIARGEYGRMSRWNGERADELIDEASAAIGDSHE